MNILVRNVNLRSTFACLFFPQIVSIQKKFSLSGGGSNPLVVGINPCPDQFWAYGEI